MLSKVTRNWQKYSFVYKGVAHACVCATLIFLVPGCRHAPTQRFQGDRNNQNVISQAQARFVDLPVPFDAALECINSPDDGNGGEGGFQALLHATTMYDVAYLDRFFRQECEYFGWRCEVTACFPSHLSHVYHKPHKSLIITCHVRRDRCEISYVYCA